MQSKRCLTALKPKVAGALMAAVVDLESLDSLFAWVTGSGNHAAIAAPPATTPSRVKAEEGSEEDEEGEAEAEAEAEEQDEDSAGEGEESEDGDADEIMNASEPEADASNTAKMKCTLCHMTDADDDLGRPGGDGAKTPFEYASQKRRFGPPV